MRKDVTMATKVGTTNERSTLNPKPIKMTTAGGKTYYDRKWQSSALSPGNRVLVRIMLEYGAPGKLHSYWEDQLCIMVS